MNIASITVEEVTAATHGLQHLNQVGSDMSQLIAPSLREGHAYACQRHVKAIAVVLQKISDAAKQSVGEKPTKKKAR